MVGRVIRLRGDAVLFVDKGVHYSYSGERLHTGHLSGLRSFESVLNP